MRYNNKGIIRVLTTMSLEKFLQELELPAGADLDPVERAMTEKLKVRLQHVADNYKESEVEEEEQWLRSFLQQFFDFSQAWIDKEAARYQSLNIRDFDTAPAVKKQARTVIGDLQDYIAAFSSCYMHINRFMTLLRDEIKAEEIKMSSAGNKVRWTPDAGVLIARYRKEKKVLVARTARMVEARALLEQVEDDFDNIRNSTGILFGKDKAEPFLRKFNASVRVTNFQKARKALKDIADAKKKFGLDQKTVKQHTDIIVASGNRIIDLAEKEQETLAGEENKILLRPFEADLAYNADVKELRKIKAFLAKYHLPYMVYKLDSLSHLKDKLLVMNTLDSLMTLYKRLIMGIAVPLKDIKTVRLYESEILNHAKYLLTGHFTELPKILQRAEETVAEFRQSRTELEEFDKIDLQEIEVKEPQAAQA